MKYFNVIIAALIFFSCHKFNSGKSGKDNGIRPSEVFAELDSIVRKNKEDTLFYCNSALIENVERLTRIKSSEGTFVGKISFTISDYNRWSDWKNKNTKLIAN